MPVCKLTDLAVKRLRPPKERWTYYWDQYLKGFGIRVASSGRKTWVCNTRCNGKLVPVTLGPLPLIPSIKDARDMARAAMLQARAGIHPVKARRAQVEKEIAEKAATEFTLRRLVAQYLEYAKAAHRPTTYTETARLLNRLLGESSLGNRPAKDIEARELRQYGNQIKPGQAGEGERWNQVRAIKTAFVWALDNDLISTNPFIGVRVPETARPQSRSRVLSDDELRRYWKATAELGSPITQLFRLLPLLGQRLGETVGMTWSELDLSGRVWTLAGERTKNGHEHRVPLPALAVEIISSVPKLARSEFLFSIDGRRPIAGISHFKRQIVEQMQSNSWRIHDLRRSCATGLQKLKVQLPITEAVLNHRSGSRGGIVSVYQVHDYWDEKVEALNTWSEYLRQLVT